MPPPEPSADRLLVAVQADRAFVRVQGRGSFKVSTAFKEFAHAALGKGCSHLVLDMADCVGMDSTFMGVLAGLAMRLRARGGRAVLVNLSLRTRGLLATLGLDQVIEPHMAGDLPADLQAVLASVPAPLEPLDTRERSMRETAETMLQAHQDLVRLSPENLPKFKDVLAFLREDLKRETERGPAG